MLIALTRHQLLRRLALRFRLYVHNLSC